MKRTNKHHGYHNKYNYTKDSKCNHCGVELIADTEDPNYNWHDSRVARHHYICYPCILFRYKENRLQHKIESLNLTYKNSVDEITEGHVYIICNPAWEGWFKVGMAVNAEDRCSQYQTSSPMRDYELKYKKVFKNRRIAEGTAHRRLERICADFQGEWFQINLNKAIQTIEDI